MADDEWIEVAAPEVDPKPRREHKAPKAPGAWIKLDRQDARTWPAPGRRIEFETIPGGIVKRARWYTHAFGRRTGLDVVSVPVIRADIQLKTILLWRYCDVD